MRSCTAPLVVALLIGGCDGSDPPRSETEQANTASADRERLNRACASPRTYDRLKELAFDEAARIRGDEARALDEVAAQAVVTMVEPIATTANPRTNVAVCTGRFVLDLPPGAENVFDGQRRLSAEIEYAAQVAEDGSGLVFDMDGAEPIILRLATIGGLPARRRHEEADGVGTQRAIADHPSDGAQRAHRASGPSFDCAYARTRSERLVCASGQLAELDRNMAALYYARMADGDVRTRRRLRETRDAFLRRREQCASEGCVRVVYEDRVGEIREIAPPS